MRYEDVAGVEFLREKRKSGPMGPICARSYMVTFTDGAMLEVVVSRITGVETCVFPVPETCRLSSHVVGSDGIGDVTAIVQWGRMQDNLEKLEEQ